MAVTRDSRLRLTGEADDPRVVAGLGTSLGQCPSAEGRARIVENLGGLYRKYPDWSGNWFGTNPLAGRFPQKTEPWDAPTMEMVQQSLAFALKGPSPEVRLRAIAGLIPIGQPAVPALREALKSEADPRNLAALAEGLGVLGDFASAPALGAIVIDPKRPEAVRVAAPDGLGMGARRITVSTAGIAKMIRKLADDGARFNLALSLHAATDHKRDRIMPINEENSLLDLKVALRSYTRVTGKEVTFEYILLRGFNDSLADAQELVRYASDVHAKVNLIEYNPIDPTATPGTTGSFQRTANEDAVAFMYFLENKGIVARIRQSRGRDIDAACGQLANKNAPALKEGERVMKG